MTDKIEESKGGGFYFALTGLPLYFGILQSCRGILTILFQFRLVIRGWPRPPEGPVVMSYYPPIFLIIGIFDILSVMLLLLLTKYRKLFYLLVLLDIVFAFAPLWYPIGVLFVFDWLLSLYSVVICILSLVHLTILLDWGLKTVTLQAEA